MNDSGSPGLEPAKRWLERVEEVWISDEIRAEPDQMSRARLVFWTCVVAGSSFLVIISLLFLASPDAVFANSVLLVGHLILCCSSLTLRWSKTVYLPGCLFCVLVVIQLSTAAFVTGGLSSPLFSLFPLAVVFMGYVLGLSAVFLCSAGLAVGTSIIWFLQVQGHGQANNEMSSTLLYATILYAIGVGLLVAWLHEHQTGKQRRRIVQELTERRRTQSQLEHANTNKDRFLAYLSHELRTPLTAILGAAELLDRTGNAPDQRRFIKSLRRASTSMARLLDDLLDLSRAEAGHLTLTIVPVELDELLSELNEAYEPLMETRGLQWQVTRSGTATSYVLADPQRLTQVLRNLLNNAMKFIEEGSVTLAITEAAEGRVHFAVTDTGIGIASDDLGTILEPYRQLGPTGRGGTGLGLPICRQLLAHMDAEIAIESVLGEGSVFSFSLPASPPIEVAAEPAAARLVEGMTVVVAEDNEAAGVVLEGLLTALGCRVTRVSDGMEAIVAVTEEKPMVAFLDVQMPRMDGLEAARQLRHEMSSGQIEPCQLIALTGNLHADAQLGAEAVFDGVLVKPVQSDELLVCLQDQQSRA